MKKNYGVQLLEFRAKHMLNQIQLAKILGVSAVMICRYENKKAQPSKRHKIVFENKMKEWEEKQNV